MMIYERHNKHPFRWVLGLVIFVLVLTVTFDEVHGLNLQLNIQRDNSTRSNLPSEPYWSPNNFDGYSNPDHKTDLGSTGTPPPPGVPEPSTLILLASGLGALHLMRRKRA